MFNTKNKSIKYASLLSLLLGFSSQSIQSMEEVNRNEMDIESQNAMILDTIVFSGQEYGQENTSDTRKPGTKRKVVSKNTVAYVFNEHLIDRIPFDVWHIIFDRLGQSKNSFVETNKTFQCIADKYYELLNNQNGYFVWDKKQVWCEFTQRMIYSSNKIIEELILRFSDRRYPNAYLSIDKSGKRILKIMSLIKEDGSFFKRDNLIKTFATLLEKRINAQPARKRPISATEQKFINHRDKVISKLNDCQNYNESLENLVSITKINLEKAQKNISNSKSNSKITDFHKIQNTSIFINNLLKKKELTPEDLKRILEDLLVSLGEIDKPSLSPISNTMKEFDEQCRLSVRFTEIMYRYIINHLSDAIPLENSNYNSNENLISSLGINKDPFFLQVTEGIQHLKNLVSKYNMNQNRSIADLQEIVDLRVYPHAYDYETLAQLYHKDNNIEQTDKYCIKFIEMAGENATRNDLIGAHNAYIRGGNQAEADKCLLRAIELAGENATIDELRNVSYAYFRTGNQGEANKCLFRVLEMAGENATADDLRQARNAYWYTGNKTESDKHSLLVIKRAAENATVNDLRWGANAYLRTGNEADADKCKIRLIKKAGNDATTDDLEKAAAAYQRAGDFQQAEECQNQIIDSWFV